MISPSYCEIKISEHTCGAKIIILYIFFSSDLKITPDIIEALRWKTTGFILYYQPPILHIRVLAKTLAGRENNQRWYYIVHDC